jgi:Uma2 family endonuclease
MVHATLAAMYTVPFTPARIRPLRRVEYDKLISLGAFQNEKIELIEGLLVPMSPIGAPHSSAVQKLTAFFVMALAGRAAVRPQSPFAAHELSEPEPDLAIVPPGDYEDDHPDRAYLIIEVAESSLSFDRGAKLCLYAASGVPEYWIVNVVDRVIEVYTGPAGDGYTRVERFERGQSLRPEQFPDVELRVTDIMK